MPPHPDRRIHRLGQPAARRPSAPPGVPWPAGTGPDGTGPAGAGRSGWTPAVVVAVIAAGCLVGGLVLAGCTSEAAPARVTEHTVVYRRIGRLALTMDVYESTRVTGPAPTVVDIHGGGWVAGSAALQRGTVDARVEAALVARGWVFVSINYRLAPRYHWPSPIEDAKCAVRFLREYAAVLHVDSSRVAVMGASAGGQLASMVGLAGPSAGFDVGPYPGVSSAVEAVVDEYGPTDLTAPDLDGSAALRRFAAEEFGVPAGEAAFALVTGSPVNYVHPGAPPFLVIQGADDNVVPPSQSEELVRRLRAAGDSAELLMVRDAGHGLVATDHQRPVPSVAQVSGETVQFLVAQLEAPAAQAFQAARTSRATQAVQAPPASRASQAAPPPR